MDTRLFVTCVLAAAQALTTAIGSTVAFLDALAGHIIEAVLLLGLTASTAFLLWCLALFLVSFGGKNPPPAHESIPRRNNAALFSCLLQWMVCISVVTGGRKWHIMFAWWEIVGYSS
jgi:hypothetical protein